MPTVVRIPPPGIPRTGRMVLPSHRALGWTDPEIRYDPFFPCHPDTTPVFLLSNVNDTLEYWEHPCPECLTIWRFCKNGGDWIWQPIQSYTDRSRPYAQPVDPIAVMRRLADEKAA